MSQEIQEQIHGGLAEIFCTPTEDFRDCPGGKMHPICVQAALTDLEQDVECELRRRGYDFTGQIKNFRSATTRYSAEKWALSQSGFRARVGHLDMSIEAVADAAEREMK